MWPDLSQPLEGRIVALEPIAAEHEDGLWQAAQDARIWEATNIRMEGRADFRRWLEHALDEQRRGVAAPFTTLDAQRRAPIGSTATARCAPSTARSRAAGPGCRPRGGARARTSRPST